MKYEATLWVDGKQAERHTFELPYGCKGWYIQGISVDAFSTRENTRLYEHNLAGCWHVPGKRCHVVFGQELEWQIKERERLAEKFGVNSELPTWHHNSVWDFYKAIGYDYKRKKYV